jgi:copper chaperone CopZ
MKKIFLSVLAVILLVGCAENSSVSTVDAKPPAQPVAFNVAGAPTVMFEVSDMVCESCSEAVHDTLARQPGAKEVIVDLEKKVATVAVDKESFDGEAAVAALLDKQFPHAKLLAAPEKPAAPDSPAEPEHNDG